MRKVTTGNTPSPRQQSANLPQPQAQEPDQHESGSRNKAVAEGSLSQHEQQEGSKREANQVFIGKRTTPLTVSVSLTELEVLPELSKLSTAPTEEREPNQLKRLSMGAIQRTSSTSQNS